MLPTPSGPLTGVSICTIHFERCTRCPELISDPRFERQDSVEDVDRTGSIWNVTPVEIVGVLDIQSPNTKNNDERATLCARTMQLENRLRTTTQSASKPLLGTVVVESTHTSTVYDHRCSRLPAVLFYEHVSTPPITSNPFTYDALPHVQTQTNRRPQYVPATFQHWFPIEDPTNVPGLEAKRTLLPPFNEVISYETYWLNDRHLELYASEGGEIHRLKKWIGTLLPALREFDWKQPIALLKFLSQLREGLNAIGFSGAAAVRLLAFLLAGDANSFYDAVTMSGTRTRNVAQTYTWPHAVHALIDRYLTDTKLQNAYDCVTLVAQGTNETENE